MEKTYKYKRAYLTVTAASGERKRLEFYGKTQREADKKKAEAEAQYKAGTLIINSSTSFERWAQEWLETFKKPRVAEGTYNDIKRTINLYFTPHLGKMPISEIRTMHLQKCVNEMSGLSQSYISHAMNYIRDIFRQAAANELIGRNPAETIIPPAAAPKKQRRALTEEEREIFMKQIHIHPKGPLFGIMLACGLRPGEARGLQWSDIDMANKTVRISRAVCRNGKNLKEPKTAAGFRTIPIPGWYIDILKSVEKKSLFVFPGPDGNYMTKQNYARSWRSFWKSCDIAAGAKTAKQLGINSCKPNDIIIHVLDQNVTPYYLRHTYATSLAEDEINVKAAQTWLGHSDIRMTLGVYTKASKKIITEAGEKIKAKC